jgi:hypothetical protein
MDHQWFEMKDVRRRRLNTAVWIPLRSSENVLKVGDIGQLGYQNEFYGAASVAFPLAEREAVGALSWTDLSISQHHRSWVDKGMYKPADVFDGYRGLHGVPLVLVQAGNSDDPSEWHLHQDLVIALALKCEVDTWVAMDEGYIEVARLKRDENGRCRLLEIRAEHLKDYLCARQMALYISSYRNREDIVTDASHISWDGNPTRELDKGDRWEGRVNPMHAGGFPVGSSAAVFHMGRENVDFKEDVPSISPSDENMTSKSWTIECKGDVIYRIQGELWRTEWVEPAPHSPRIRGDELPPSVFFIIDAAGTLKGGTELSAIGGWLWFRPEVMMVLAHRRGGAMTWYTRDTGGVKCGPSSLTTFGVNRLGLVNVYAEDLAHLPEWHQKLWAGYNVSPEGGVSEELLATQAEGEPARTQAPEGFLQKALERLDATFKSEFGSSLLRHHEYSSTLLTHAHRFRATDLQNLFSLGKDLARLTAESIDQAALHKIAPPQGNEGKGSLKSLERVLAQKVHPDEARWLVGPLFAINDLRQADAHLPGRDLDEPFSLLKIDRSAPFVMQGFQMIDMCVTALFTIAKRLKEESDRCL